MLNIIRHILKLSIKKFLDFFFFFSNVAIFIKISTFRDRKRLCVVGGSVTRARREPRRPTGGRASNRAAVVRFGECDTGYRRPSGEPALCRCPWTPCKLQSDRRLGLIKGFNPFWRRLRCAGGGRDGAVAILFLSSIVWADDDAVPGWVGLCPWLVFDL